LKGLDDSWLGLCVLLFRLATGICRASYVRQVGGQKPDEEATQTVIQNC